MGQERRARRYWSEGEKRRIVAQTRVPVLIRDPASLCRFLNQRRFDRQAILQFFPQTSSGRRTLAIAPTAESKISSGGGP